jgi:uncharacterized protein (TIGR01370 family)
MPSLRAIFAVFWVSLATAILMAGCSIVSNSESPGPSPRVASIESFAVYLANPWLDTLSTFDLVVIDPDNRSAAEIAQLRKRGTRPIAYVNLGEAETYRYFYDQVNPDWLLGPNPNWDDHYYVDARAEGWRRLLLATVLPNIKKKGFDGFFFDMVDTALPGLHPETKPGMVRLIVDIRTAYPSSTLIMNNGLFLVDEVASSLDALIVENVFTRFDFDAQRYVRTSPSTRTSLVSRLRTIERTHGLRPFLLNYAETPQSPHRTYAALEARRNDFLDFVSTVELDTVFPPRPHP